MKMLFDGFEGNLTSSKWAMICKVSQDTASREINMLVAKAILKQQGQGRSTHYVLWGTGNVERQSPCGAAKSCVS